MAIYSDLVDIDPQKLIDARKIIGWSQYDLAAQSGVSRSYVSEIEKGRKRPRQNVAERLADALSKKVLDLVA